MPSKGTLFVGVPGCGKSLTAETVAQEWEPPLFRFDIGAIFNKWIGESEGKMREALQFIENVSPCALQVDETEKVLAASDNGNETGERVLGEFLFWIQELINKVFMVATVSDVKVLPYELYRKGRFLEIFYTSLPDDEERREALVLYTKASLRAEAKEELLKELVEITKGYSYSDIGTTVKEVAQKVLLKGRDAASKAELIHAINSIIPVSQISPELICEIDEWEEERAVNTFEHYRG